MSNFINTGMTLQGKPLKKCLKHNTTTTESCNKCKALITRSEFDYGMGECLSCFPEI